MGRKLALVIGNSHYEDQSLSRLITPDADVNALANILRAPNVGGFEEVTTLVNEAATNVRKAVARLFKEKSPDDLLLLYFSGHGVLDDQGQLYLAVKDTERDLLSGTAIPAHFITSEMDRSRSKRQVLMLDCCHSGAFARGSKGVVGASVGISSAFEGTGYGRVVLTATDATQYAWEGDQVIGQAENSVFTYFMIQGLQTGEADIDADGRITLDELYDYVYGQVVSRTPKQTPGKWSYRQQGDIVVAKNPHAIHKPVELPLELQQALSSPLAEIRVGAIKALDKYLGGPQRDLALLALAALERLTKDDSRSVASAARRILRAYTAQKAEAERVAREAERAEQERLEKDSLEAERLAQEKAEAERLARDAERAEQERLAEERAKAERVAALKAEEERLAREDQERVASEQAERAEQERLEQQRLEAERLAAQRAEEERREKEKAKVVEAPHQATQVVSRRGITTRWRWIGLALGVAAVVVVWAIVQAPNPLRPTLQPTSTRQLQPTSASQPTMAPTTRTRSIDGMTMVYVPGGTFKMGSDTGEDDQKPVHQVTLDSFWIDRTEVTNAQYAQCVAAKQCQVPSDKTSYTHASYYDNSGFANYPVIYVSWDDARKYCAWAGGQLPTEAQWEYAARGPQSYTYPWGDGPISDDRMNFSLNVSDTAEVGSYPNGASWVGALDMDGNVWEWVNDWYGPYPDSSQTNPTGPTFGDRRIQRGGPWLHISADNLRSAYRYINTPDSRDFENGFRCAATQEVVPAVLPTAAPTLQPTETRTRSIDGMTMVYVPGGTFKMGSDTGYDHEKPVHQVTLDSFWIDRTEVTNTEFRRFVADTSYRTDAEKTGTGLVYDAVKNGWSATPSADWQHPRGPGSKLNGLDEHPVVQVSWNDAVANCKWAGGQLPTEAQWEYAARGPLGYTYPWGNDFDGTRLNYNGDVGDTTEVGSYPQGASWVGALEMAGNVSQWVNDWDGAYPDSPQTNPTGPTSGRYRVLRGAPWYYDATIVYTAARAASAPDHRSDSDGFRCAATQEVVPALLPMAAPTLRPTQTRTRSTDGMTMVYVPGGAFNMGSETGDSDEKPIHGVTLDSFWIERTEVTNAQYAKCVEAKRCQALSNKKSPTHASYYGNSDFANYPVIFVSWDDVRKYCAWAGGQLPTEAQWEYAARGPRGYTYPWGDEPPSKDRLNYNENVGDTTEVGSYPQGASWVGALDMAGNVWEWVNDWYGSYPDSSQTNPTGPTSGESRVLRGGSWIMNADNVRSAYRGDYSPSPAGRNGDVGFRCAVSAGG